MKQFLLVFLLMSGSSLALADDYSLVCYSIVKDGKGSAKPCVLERSFNTGFETSIYTINDKTYNVLINGNVDPEVTLINKKIGQRYYRNSWFNKVVDQYANDVKYECLKSATVHFCAQRAGYGD